jgi:hypothetical protein
MSISTHPEKDRKSSGASWARTGQHKAQQTRDARADLAAKQRKAIREKQFADGRWWKWRSKKPSISFVCHPLRIAGKLYLVRCVLPYCIDTSTKNKTDVMRNPQRYYELQTIPQGASLGRAVMRFHSLTAVQMHLNALRREALLPLDDPNRPLPALIIKPKPVWKPSPWKHIIARLEDEMFFRAPNVEAPAVETKIIPFPAEPEKIDIATVLKHGGKTFKTRKDSCAHIVVTQDVKTGRLERSAGDPLCQPAGKFPRLLDFVPAGDPVCTKCAEMAERYDLPMPPNVHVVDLPSSRKLTPSDPPVRYKLNSRWFSYEFGFPFAGYLRKWDWLRSRTCCAQCGSKVTDKRGDQPVHGAEIHMYYVCASGHPIRDERDLRWPGPFMPKNPGVEGKAYDAGEMLASDAYKHLVAKPDDEDVPF